MSPSPWKTSCRASAGERCQDSPGRHCLIGSPTDDPVGSRGEGRVTQAEREQYAERALAAAKTGPLYDGSRSQALLDIARYLPIRVLRLAIADAKALTHDFLRDSALGALLPALGAAGAAPEAWAEAKLLDGCNRAEVMSALISVVPSHLIEELPRLAPCFASGYEGETLLARSAEHLPESGLQDLFEPLLTNASKYEEGVLLLSRVAHHTPTPLRERVRRVAQASDRHLVRATILAGLAAPPVSDDRERLPSEAIARLLPPDDANQLPYAVAAIASATPAGCMDELLERVRSWPDRHGREEALASLATHLRQDQVTDLLAIADRSREEPRVVAALVRRLARFGAEDEALHHYMRLPNWAGREIDLAAEVAALTDGRSFNSRRVPSFNFWPLSVRGSHLAPAL